MERTITVKGVGSYSAKPDTVEISVQLSGKSPDYAQAVEREAEKYEFIISAVEKCGVVGEKITTSSYNVHAAGRYVKNSYVSDGWECTRRITVSFPLDPLKLSAVTSAIAHSLSEPSMSISFTLSDTEEAKYILLQNAAADACSKARMLAKATGVRLGEIQRIDYSWSDISFYSDPVYGDSCLADLNDSPGFVPEDIDLSENVTFIWAIA